MAGVDWRSTTVDNTVTAQGYEHTTEDSILETVIGSWIAFDTI